MNEIAVGRSVRARLGARSGEPSVAQLSLLDHQMVPRPTDVAGWIAQARRDGFLALRTAALFPESTASFLDAGFAEVDRLTLLELALHADRRPPRRSGRTRRMSARDLPAAAGVDRLAFGARWCNDESALVEIRRATPHHRSRVVGAGRVVGFAISGRAGRTGYLQRLAIEPAEQRRGHGRVLVHDALAWMVRHGVTTALVNTGADNAAALALYGSEGFRVCPDELVVLERPLR